MCYNFDWQIPNVLTCVLSMSRITSMDHLKHFKGAKWLSAGEAAARLGCSTEHVRRLVGEGLIPAKRHRGRVIKITDRALAAYMASQPDAARKDRDE